VEYAVGRLHFDDADGYRQYVTSLIDYEQADAAPRDRAAGFFGTGTRSTVPLSCRLTCSCGRWQKASRLMAGSRLPFPAIKSILPCWNGRLPRPLAEILADTGPLGRPALLLGFRVL
jgi:hypothetical protein